MFRAIPRVLCALLVTCLTLGSVGRAETVMKIDLGLDSTADLQLAGGIFSTRDDGQAGTTGQQNTNLIVSDFLDSKQVDILTGNASMTLSDVLINGAPTVLFNTVFQPTSGGTFAIYDTSNSLLLGGTLIDGVLSGPIGASQTGSFLTASFGAFTGGSLLPYVNPKSASLSISLTNVISTGGLKGLQISDGQLAGFTADATANVGALVPEPSCGLLTACGLIGLAGATRRRRAA